MICIGAGPGPKNVLCEDTQGNRTVVPYAIWKYKYKEERVADYATVTGFIQFDVDTRDLSTGQEVRDVTIRSTTTGELIRITVWPDFDNTELYKGQFIAVDGEVTVREVGDKVYTNLSARSIAVLDAEAPKEREVVKKERKGF